jgi:hypothetical protein
MRISQIFLGTRRIWIFDGISVFKTIWVYIPCKKHSYLEKNALESIWSRMLLTQIIVTRVYKERFSQLDIPTNYEYLTGIIILIPAGRFFDTIDDDVVLLILCNHLYTRPTYQTNIWCNCPDFPPETPITDQFWKQSWWIFWIVWPCGFYFLFSCDCVFGRVELLHMWFAGCWETAASLHGIACWPLKTTSPLSSAWVFVSFGPRNNLGHISSKLIYGQKISPENINACESNYCAIISSTLQNKILLGARKLEVCDGNPNLSFSKKKSGRNTFTINTLE